MISYTSIRLNLTSKTRGYNGKDPNLAHSCSFLNTNHFFPFFGRGGGGIVITTLLNNKQNQKQEAECNRDDKSQVSSVFVES